MRESRAEDDVIADIAAEELEAYLGSHLVTVNYTKMAAKDIPSCQQFKNSGLFLSGFFIRNIAISNCDSRDMDTR